jgi:hypothetical protein
VERSLRAPRVHHNPATTTAHTNALLEEIRAVAAT